MKKLSDLIDLPVSTKNSDGMQTCILGADKGDGKRQLVAVITEAELAEALTYAINHHDVLVKRVQRRDLVQAMESALADHITHLRTTSLSVELFKPSGKWYAREDVTMTFVEELKLVEDLVKHIRKFFNGRYGGMRAVCLVNPLGFPISFDIPERDYNVVGKEV